MRGRGISGGNISLGPKETFPPGPLSEKGGREGEDIIFLYLMRRIGI